MTQLIVTVDILNKRKAIPAALPDPSSVAETVHKGYTFQGTLVPNAPGQATGGWYKDSDNYYYWAGGVSVNNPAAISVSPSTVKATILGIDVSRYQAKAINWPMAKDSISFVYVKATEGLFTTDPLCNAHSSGAKAAGIKIGYYHFALVSKDAVQQAQHFDRVIKGLSKADIMPVLDIETNKANLSQEEMETWVETFINALNNLGYPQVVIYSCYSFLCQNLLPTHSLGKHPLWLAEYNNHPSPKLPPGWDNFTIWQYDEDGTVSGILDKVDMNRAVSNFL